MILLVDDEEDVLDCYQSLLEMSGHAVSAHSCPSQAFTCFQSAPHTFTTLITDYNMPNMNGLDLIDNIHNICPNIKAVLYSGMLPDNIPKHIITLQKPVRFSHFLKALNTNQAA